MSLRVRASLLANQSAGLLTSLPSPLASLPASPPATSLTSPPTPPADSAVHLQSLQFTISWKLLALQAH